MAWDDYDISVHEHEEQIKRIDNSVDVLFDKIENGTGITNHGYTVTIDNCTCPDFITRKLPCKHIYALAKQLKRFIVPQKMERKKDLIVELNENGFSQEWAFVIRKCNYPSLDIRWNDVMKCYTQGEDFHFDVGTVFYDTPVAYSNEAWGDVLPKINFSIQVLSSTTNFRHYKLETKDNILYAMPRMEYGVTSFNVYKVDRSINKEVFYKKFSCSNESFIALLRDGFCKSFSGEDINIKNWNE
jgi:hypothetical protein